MSVPTIVQCGSNQTLTNRCVRNTQGSYVDWAEMCAHLCKYKLGGPNCTCELHRVFSFSVHDLFNN